MMVHWGYINWPPAWKRRVVADDTGVMAVYDTDDVLCVDSWDWYDHDTGDSGRDALLYPNWYIVETSNFRHSSRTPD